MRDIVALALFGFPFFAFFLFVILPPRRALLISYIGGWLFLPQAEFAFAGAPNYGKPTAIALGVIVGSLTVDRLRLLSFRPRWFDMPIAVYCLWPFFSQVANGHSPLAGLNWVTEHTLLMGVPYLLGRVYFTTRAEIRELAVAVFIGGLIYAPLCWFEIRFSPKLHLLVYGYLQHSLLQHMRYGGYRPIVFMQHGIMVGVWMASASFVGFWLWQDGLLTRFKQIPMVVLVPFMIVTTIFCKSGTGVALLGLAIAVYFASRIGLRTVALATLALTPAVYIFVRATGTWSGEGLVSLIAEFDEKRAGSLRVRMLQEDVYSVQAAKSLLFGFADGDFIPLNEDGVPMTRGNDAYWIIAFGLYGAVGLISFFATLALPVLLVAYRDKADNRDTATIALALVMVVFALDCLFNGMINPIFLLAAGAVTSVSTGLERRPFVLSRAGSSIARRGQILPVPTRVPTVSKVQQADEVLTER